MALAVPAGGFASAGRRTARQFPEFFMKRCANGRFYAIIPLIMRRRGDKLPRYDAILFDVDGTLIHSRPGIENTFAYAFRRMGLDPADKIGRASCRERV